MAYKFPPALYSRDQALGVAEELHVYAAQLAQRRHKDPKVTIPELSNLAAELLRSLPAAKREDDAAVEDLRLAIEQLTEKLPTVTLILSAIAPRGMKEELVTWVRENVAADVLVDFHVNPDIGGGVVIRTASKIYDCSWRRLLEDNAAHFTEALTRV